MKPGPAISAAVIFFFSRSKSAITMAISLGFLPVLAATIMAALVAISPCAASFGGSAVILSTATSGYLSFTKALMVLFISAKIFMGRYVSEIPCLCNNPLWLI